MADVMLPIPEAELDWSYARSGGPGGQNVNTLSTKAVLRWDMASSRAITASVKVRIARLYPSKVTQAGEVVLSSQVFRTQDRNRQECREKLAEMIAVASVIPKPRIKSKPTKGSKTRRLAAKKRESARKADRQVRDD